MASEAKMAGDLAVFATASLKSIDSAANMLKAFTIFFAKLLENQESRQQLIDFYQAGLGEEAKLPPGEKLSIVSYSINPTYAKQLYGICKREGIGHINTQSNTFDLVMDGKGDNIKKISDAVWIYSTQQKDFHLAVAEAKARSGYEQEIPREIGNKFITKLIKSNNPMKEIKDIPLEQYLSIRKDVQKLDKEMRFTMFPKYREVDGKTLVDIGFLSKTEKLYDKKGKAYREPKEYNISEILKGLIYKQKMIERDPALSNYFTGIKVREDFKQKTITDLLDNKLSTARSLEKQLNDSGLSDPSKEHLIKILQKYNQNPEAKLELIEELKRNNELSDREKNFLIKSANELGNESYVVPAKIVREGNDINYEVSLKESICVGKDMTIRTAGKDDLVIDDPTSMRNNLDKKISEFTDKGKTNEQFTFVVLSAKEFNEIEKGNPEFIKEKNVLKKRKINFFKDRDDKELFDKTDAEKTAESKCEGVIDKINENKEKFMLESEQTLTGIERFDEHYDAIINEIITEQDHKEEVVQEEIEAKEATIEDEIREEINKIVDEPASNDNFDEYLKSEIGDDRETQIGNIELEVATR